MNYRPQNEIGAGDNFVLSVGNNQGATLALRNLGAAQARLKDTQSVLSTGQKVSSPRDNAASYIIAQKNRAAIVETQVLGQNQARAQSMLGVTQTAISNVADLISQMKEKALLLNDTSMSSASVRALRSELNEQAAQIDSIAKSATFDGVNMIGSAPPVTTRWGRPYAGYITFGTAYASYTTGGEAGRMDIYLDVRQAVNQSITVNWGDGTVFSNTVTGAPATDYSTVLSHQYEAGANASMDYNISISGPAGAGFNIGGINFVPDGDTTTVPVYGGGGTISFAHKSMLSSALGLDALDTLAPAQVLATVDNAAATAANAAAYYAFRQNDIERVLTQTARREDILTKAQGDLIDADMGKTAALWQAEQTKAQLATQSLSIANQSTRLLLSLFG